MTLFALGINHNSASVALREKVIFSVESLQQAIDSLLRQPQIQGAVLLSTCNRTELYLAACPSDTLYTELVAWLATYHNISQEQLAPSLYWHQHEHAVEHLMRVTSGLDSMVLGESQILGQVKKAYNDAQINQSLPIELDRLFQRVFATAKRVRTETNIGANTVSVAFAACLLCRQFFTSLSDLGILLIGAGETIELAARHLAKQQAGRILIANRTLQHAQSLAEQVGAQVIGLEDIKDHLQQADIIISSTASRYPIVSTAWVEQALAARAGRPMVFIDLAVPRDIDPEVGDLPAVHLYSLDDLQTVIQRNLVQRQVAAVEAGQIIRQECASFMNWLQMQEEIEVIRNYRYQADVIRQEMESRALTSLRQGGDAEFIIHELARRLTRRLIHTPTKILQDAVLQGDQTRLQLLCDSLCTSLEAD